MDDKEFFDKLFQLFTKTTQAEDSYWMPEAQPDGSGRFYLWAVDKEQNRKRVAEGLKEADADWITALHGCFPDLIRYLLRVTDEAERLDMERDQLTNELVEMGNKLERYEA